MTGPHNTLATLHLLPYAREMQSYLIDMAAAITGKRSPPADYIPRLDRHSDLFVTPADCVKLMEDICTIYRDKGYCTLQALENDLIALYHPDLPQNAIRIADLYATDEMTRDRMTGFFHKTHVPLAMGFAALYEHATGNPVTIIEIDYTNMRGTNEHFEKLLQASEGATSQSPGQKNITNEAMRLTDIAAYVIARTFYNTLTDALKDRDDAFIVPLRNGGDEVRIILCNVTTDEADIILHDIHERVEYQTAYMGLHDHAYAKSPLDPFSRGFGACGTVFALKAEGQQSYNTLIRDAEQTIQSTKLRLGQARRNNRAFNIVKPGACTVPDCYDSPEAAFACLESSIAAMTARYECLQPKDGTDALLTPTLKDMLNGRTVFHFPTLSQIHDKACNRLQKTLEEQGLNLTPAQQRMLQIKIMKLLSQDYASGTLMARDFPAMVGAAYTTVNSANAHYGRSDALLTLGASFHNVAGLNDLLGHEITNIVLRYQAHDILEQSLIKIGVNKDNMILTHMGGGEFRAVIQPAIPLADGSLRIISTDLIQKACGDAIARTALLNDSRIGLFLERHGLADSALSFGGTCFKDIQNPYNRTTGRPNGISVTLSAKPYAENRGARTNHPRQGSEICSFIGNHLADAITDHRAVAPTVPLPAYSL